MKLMPLFLLAGALAAQAPPYDLLLKGGHVIDPKNGVSAIRDVAIRDGKIAAVSPSIASSLARKTVPVAGLYVTPGLIDIHAHVFSGPNGPMLAGGDWSIFPDTFAFRTGVTTVVDAGSSGRHNFAEFKRTVIDRSRARVLVFLNILGAGMPGGNLEQDVADMDAKAAGALAIANRDTIVGIKVAHYRGPDWVPLERGVEAASLAGIPVMIDFGTFRPERPFQELVLNKLRPGDMYTHAFYGAVPLLDEAGKLLPYLFAARKRGVLFDVGHGGAALIFRQAAPAVRQGFPPDSISTDVHAGSLLAGMKDMLNVMSKFLNMGMTLDGVVLRSTWNPARQIQRQELGHLSVGALADLAVLRLEKGDFGFVDSLGARLPGDRRLQCELTIQNGLVVFDQNGITRDNWDKLGNYSAQGGRWWDATRETGRRRR